MCEYMHDCLQRNGCFWLPYNMATAVVYDRSAPSHTPFPSSSAPPSLSSSLLLSSFFLGGGHSTAEPMVRSWDGFLIQENSSWMKDGGGSLSWREKHAVIGGNIIQKNWLRQRECIREREGKGGV